MTLEFEKEKAHTTIDTIAGKALYFGTEIEDRQERWNQDYNVNQGFWVIHEGAKHHVYRVRI